MTRHRKTNSPKINFTISIIFHGALIFAIVFFAAREGMLGKKMKEIAVVIVPKEKKPEPPKEKPPEPKPEPPKEETAPAPKPAARPAVQTAQTAPPPGAAVPMAAPPPAQAPAFEFSDGAKVVQTSNDPNLIYKGIVEYVLRSHWNRPEDVDDAGFEAEVEISIDADGNLTRSNWLKSSGDSHWDDSVRRALTQSKSTGRRPPKNFPGKFVVRFDALVEGEPLSME